MPIFRTLTLILPAIIPSWRFFDVIAPSPRIQFALLDLDDKSANENIHWRDFCTHPASISFATMLRRMFWNPRRNETLFLVSCAERLIQQPTSHSETEILKRIVRDLKGDVSNMYPAGSCVQFRLLLVQRNGEQLQQKAVFHSRIQSLAEQDTM